MRAVPSFLIKLFLKPKITTIDFINYQLVTDAYSYVDSNNEIDFESTAVEHRNIKIVVNFNNIKEAENKQMIKAINCISKEI